jgi:hypothetical protein
MSYSWVGPPTEFNGTNEITGGDSGTYRLLCFCARAEYYTNIAHDLLLNATFSRRHTN